MMTQATSRQHRERAILELVAQHRPKSQAELGALLAEQGIEANQATLSRDMRRLGLRKGPTGYEVPDTATDPLVRAVQAWLTEIRPAQQLLVLKTPPGGAQPLGVALDADPPDELVGTVAGDDTVLAICPDPASAERLAARLREWTST